MGYSHRAGITKEEQPALLRIAYIAIGLFIGILAGLILVYICIQSSVQPNQLYMN